jgi:Zn-dependent peptidase ImmA (M78 family)
MSQWVDDLPVMLVNERIPTDRLRLTIAHELGHLCLHSLEITSTMEDEANSFAAEFLMPTEAIRSQLRNLTLGRLQDLKREWGVSMQALIEKAHAIGYLTSQRRTSMYKSFSANGWRIREPGSDALPPETTQLPARIADAVLARGLSPDELARIAGFATPADNTLFQPVQPRLRCV